MINGAVRRERIEQGSRIGRGVVHLSDPALTIAILGGRTLAVTPLADYDTSVIADDFAGVAGWLCWPDRWTLFGRGAMPVVFVAEHGRGLGGGGMLKREGERESPPGATRGGKKGPRRKK